jgi:hypothetical protein
MQLYLVGLEHPRDEGPLEQPIIARNPEQAFNLWLDFVVHHGAQSLEPAMEVYIIAMPHIAILGCCEPASASPLPDANARVLRWYLDCDYAYRVILAHELEARVDAGQSPRTPY